MNGKQEVRELNVELRKIVDSMDHICLTCGTIEKAPIFALCVMGGGALVNIMKVHAEPYMCKSCRKRIDDKRIEMAEKE